MTVTVSWCRDDVTSEHQHIDIDTDNAHSDCAAVTLSVITLLVNISYCGNENKNVGGRGCVTFLPSFYPPYPAPSRHGVWGAL